MQLDAQSAVLFASVTNATMPGGVLHKKLQYQAIDSPSVQGVAGNMRRKLIYRAVKYLPREGEYCNELS